MMRKLKNTGLAGDDGEESGLLQQATEMVLWEGPHLAHHEERVEEDPQSASPRGRGESGGKRRKRPQPPLSREAVARFLEAARPHVEWLEFVQRESMLAYE